MWDLCPFTDLTDLKDEKYQRTDQKNAERRRNVEFVLKNNSELSFLFLNVALRRRN